MNEPKRLHVLPPDRTGVPARHPDDGYPLPRPYPMGARTLRVLEALMRAVLPPPPAPRGADLEARVMKHVRVLVACMPTVTARGFVLLMHLLDWAPLWRFRHLRPITRLSPEEGSAVIDGIVRSRSLLVRMMALGPKGAILTGYYDQDEVHAELGYEPLSFFRERIALRARLVAGESPEASPLHHAGGAP